MTSAVLDALRALVEHAVRTLGYGGVALLMLVENAFPPLPSELVVPFAGFLVASGEMAAPLVLLASTAGSLAGALVLYLLGGWLGEARLRSAVRRYGRPLRLREEDLEGALELFRRRGRQAVLWGRLVPGVRSLVSLPAGITRMPLASFALLTTLGSLLWNGLLLAAGIVLGRNWNAVLGVVDSYEALLGIALAALLAAAAVRRRLRAANGVRAVRAAAAALPVAPADGPPGDLANVPAPPYDPARSGE